MDLRAMASEDFPPDGAEAEVREAGAQDLAIERVELAPDVELVLWFAEELGNSSYLLDVSGADVSVLVDPLRDIDAYLPSLARTRSRQILALETHVHNDFVSGSRELIAVSGATLGASGEAPLHYPHQALGEGDEIPLGEYRLRVWATPGHTPEHVSYLLVRAREEPLALFSGGALMVGSAARTDLLGPLQARPLALRLYKTLNERIALLPDTTRVFPTHGGGTFCGAGDSDRHSTTLGEERSSNRLLRETTVDGFLAQILEQRPYPQYFDRMRVVNLTGAPLRGSRPFEVPSLGIEAFEAARSAGALTIDLRPFGEYDSGHIPESYSIGIDGAFSAWAGWLLPPDRPIVFVADAGSSATRAARQLFRIGYDNIAGALRDGIQSWKASARPLRSIPRIASSELVRSVRSEPPLTILDVRDDREYASGHVPGDLHIPLGNLAGRLREIPRGAPIIVHCAHGYRSAIALSLLERDGFVGLVHADEGYEGWDRARHEP
jgi:hydroxyacylglutathione hydrolase